MAVEVLIKARNTHGSYLKGYPISIEPEGHVWGNKEGLPNFIRVSVTGTITAEQAMLYLDQWRTYYDYEVVNHNILQDAYRVRLWVIDPSVSGINSITRQQVEGYLNGWNAVYKSAAQNEVIFDFSVYESAISKNFWGLWVFSIVFNEVSYNQGTGEHVIDADYSVLMVEPKKIERRVAVAISDGGQIISHQDEVIRFSVTRQLILQTLKTRMHDRMASVFEERLWYVNEGDVDNIVSQGGVAEVDKTTFISYLRKRTDE